MSVRVYRFHAGGEENYEQSVRRLADEVGWTPDFDESTWAALRETTTPIAASRSSMTREQFINRILREIKTRDVRFHAPSEASK